MVTMIYPEQTLRFSGRNYIAPMFIRSPAHKTTHRRIKRRLVPMSNIISS